MADEKKPDTATITTANGHWLCEGIQLRERKLVSKTVGRFILWLFFHRTDTVTQVELSGFSGSPVDPIVKVLYDENGDITG